MGNSGWFIGTLYSGLVSATISNSLGLFSDMGCLFIMMNISVVLVALVLCGKSGGQFI